MGRVFVLMRAREAPRPSFAARASLGLEDDRGRDRPRLGGGGEAARSLSRYIANDRRASLESYLRNIAVSTQRLSLMRAPRHLSP